MISQLQETNKTENNALQKTDKAESRIGQMELKLKKAQYTPNWNIENRGRGIFKGIIAKLYSDSRSLINHRQNN